MPKDPDPPRAAKAYRAKLPDLSDENYDNWERHVKHTFYASGWIKFFEASKSEDKIKEVKETTEEDRRGA